MMDFTNTKWIDHADNPLIEPIFPDWMVADPSVLTPDQSPDGRWHLFANAIIQGIQHFVSEDGVRWDRVAKKLFIGIRPYIVHDGDLYYLFYEKPQGIGSAISLRTSPDLISWSDAIPVLAPEFKWEGKGLKTNGNPCVVHHNGRWRLYFSASWVFLPDCLFLEPLYIGVAESDSLAGPFVKRPEPLIGPSLDPAFRNMGAGSIKVLPPADGAPWIGFNNGIYRDVDGHSRSEIHLLHSDDGYDWKLVSESPLIAPTNVGWKRALVYAMHVVHFNDEWRMYYNARDGWFIGKERIGLAIANP
jgi:predicted GH43/DUF377 family glycosyl hydrolase